MTRTPMLEIVARRDNDSGEPLLFYVQAGDVWVYDHIGNHIASNREYFLDGTRQCSYRDADVRRLVEKFDSLTPKIPFRCMRRLKWA